MKHNYLELSEERTNLLKRVIEAKEEAKKAYHLAKVTPTMRDLAIMLVPFQEELTRLFSPLADEDKYVTIQYPGWWVGDKRKDILHDFVLWFGGEDEGE